MNFEVYTTALVPKAEQETVINYDGKTNEWMIFTNNPDHIRDWKGVIVPSDNYRNSKGFDRETGRVVEIEGKIKSNVEVSEMLQV